MGMVCAYNEGLVENCHSSGTIDSGISNRGGLVGYNNGTVRLCSSDVTVKGSGYSIGGLVGYNRKVCPS